MKIILKAVAHSLPRDRGLTSCPVTLNTHQIIAAENALRGKEIDYKVLSWNPQDKVENAFFYSIAIYGVPISFVFIYSPNEFLNLPKEKVWDELKRDLKMYLRYCFNKGNGMIDPDLLGL